LLWFELTEWRRESHAVIVLAAMSTALGATTHSGEIDVEAGLHAQGTGVLQQAVCRGKAPPTWRI